MYSRPQWGRSYPSIAVVAATVVTAAVAAATVVAVTVIASAAVAAKIADAGYGVAAGIAAGIGNKVRERDTSDVGKTAIAGHKFSSKRKNVAGAFAPTTVYAPGSFGVLLQPAAKGILFFQPGFRIGSHHAFRSQNHILQICDGSLDRRYRAVAQFMDRRRFLFLLHGPHPGIIV